MNAFTFRDQIVQSYEQFSRSFVKIAATDISDVVNSEYEDGRYWPEPLIQINPNYKQCSTVLELADAGVLHPFTSKIFHVRDKAENLIPIRLHKHQQDALALAQHGRSYVVTTGTGSGKSLAFFIPIVDRILKARAQDDTPRTRAIIIYPMNALANSQAEEIGKFLGNHGTNGEGFRAFHNGEFSRNLKNPESFNFVIQLNHLALRISNATPCKQVNPVTNESRILHSQWKLMTWENMEDQLCSPCFITDRTVGMEKADSPVFKNISEFGKACVVSTGLIPLEFEESEIRKAQESLHKDYLP